MKPLQSLLGHSWTVIILVFFTATSSSPADITLPAIISDHAVLQRSEKACVWGKADSAEKVSVCIGGTTAETTAGADGRWKVELNLKSKGPGPYDLVIKGKNQIVVKDVLFGEVWICCGQSNMEYNLNGTLSFREEVAESANPFLRQFRVDHVASAKPLGEVGGKWTVAGPDSSGAFTAVGYYFGKAVQKDLKVPVGLVNASWFASPVEAWTSQEALDKVEALKKEKDKWVTLDERFGAYVKRWQEWKTKYGRQDHPAANADIFAAPDVSMEDWKAVKVPGALAGNGLPDAGVIWLRHKIKIDASQANKELSLTLPELRLGQVYWDGVKIDEVAPDILRAAMSWRPPWDIHVPAKLVKEGASTLAIRLFTPAGGPQLLTDEKGCPLMAGEWLAKSEYELPALDEEGMSAYPGMPPVKGLPKYLMPSYLFSGMINPILPYAIKGVIWYQGEANAWEPAAYLKKFSLLVNDWRGRWGSDLPFFYCQMPSMGAVKSTALTESSPAQFREAQSMALSLPDTGQAILMDISDTDLHPRNKKDPGERLARIALAKTYGRKIAFSGPVYESMSVEGNKIRLAFRYAEGGLVAKPLPGDYILRYKSVSPDVPETAPLELPSPGSELQGFAVRGENGQWKWASAKIVRSSGNPPGSDTVVAWSDEVSQPVALRYGWADNPSCNLYNGEGLPASPFRTDPPAVNANGATGK